MAAVELLARVAFKPNCELENVRASLLLRRIARMCDYVSGYPENTAGDARTIPYVRDNGFYLRFSSETPERVLFAIRKSFFVEDCILMDAQSTPPPFVASSEAEESSPVEGPAATFDLFAGAMANDQGLLLLLAHFDEIRRSLRPYAADHPEDRRLGDLAFAHERATDALRTAVARSRVEPFNRISPSLHQLVDDQAHRSGVEVDLEVMDNQMELDRTVLSTLEEIVKRVLRVVVRNYIESPDKRLAEGKPRRALVRIRIESDGATVVCRCNHDGRRFDARAAGKVAQDNGMLARPLDLYTDDEIGRLSILPYLLANGDNKEMEPAFELSEIGSMLHRAGGRGEVRNRTDGVTETALYLPVPYIAFGIALFSLGEQRFGLPASQIERFEAFREGRLERDEEGRAFYCDGSGERYLLLNDIHSGLSTAEQPSAVILMSTQDAHGALATSTVDGYEHATVNRIPDILERKMLRQAGCLGYSLLNDGSLCTVLNARYLLSAERGRKEQL